MHDPEIRSLLAFLRRNGAFIELHDDTVQAWAFALRHYDGQAVKAGVLWFLERHHPREIAPATIAAAVRSLLASGKITERTCPDHPQEIARACRCCAADVLTGERPRELVGQQIAGVSGGAMGNPAPLMQGSVSSPSDLRAVDPARWDRLHTQGAAERSQALADDQNPSVGAPGAPGAPATRLRAVS